MRGRRLRVRLLRSHRDQTRTSPVGAANLARRAQRDGRHGDTTALLSSSAREAKGETVVKSVNVAAAMGLAAIVSLVAGAPVKAQEFDRGQIANAEVERTAATHRP